MTEIGVATTTLTTNRWNWRGTTGPTGTVVTDIPQENPFMLTFSTDGTASSATDCNSMSSGYTADDAGTLSFSEFAMTMMYCEDSKEFEYSQQLSQAERFSFPNSETLYLHLANDAGVMIFMKIK
jgi:heat shock protein HslJ